MAGKQYISSGEFNPTLTFFSVFIGIFLAIIIGALYALISYYNPFIYLNFLVLAGAVIASAAIGMFITYFNKSRNIIINFLISVVICFTTWFANWAYYYSHYSNSGFISTLFQPGNVFSFIFKYGDEHQITLNSLRTLGSHGITFSGELLTIFYLIEFGAFMFPVYLTSNVDYYCENCEEFYQTKEGYIENIGPFNDRLNTTTDGNYEFIEEMDFRRKMDALRSNPNDKPEILKLKYHYCKECRKNSIIDIYLATLQLNSNKKTELVHENNIIKGIYINEKTDEILRQRFIV